MKNFLRICLLIIAVTFMHESKAQISVSINLNAQPPWGPSGYNYVDYYYLPEVDAYYYVPQRQWIFFEGNRWVFYNQQPARYRNINLYNTYKVVINEPKPYLNHQVYYAKYKPYKNFHGRQGVLKENHGHEQAHGNPNNHGEQHTEKQNHGHDNGQHQQAHGNGDKHENGGGNGNGKGHGNGKKDGGGKGH